MKAILPKVLPILAVAGVFAPAALARTTARRAPFDLPEHAVALRSLEGELVSVDPLCPDDAWCITDGTVITLRYTLDGCLDSLAPVAYQALDTDDGKLHVFVHAQEIVDARSAQALCPRRPEKEVKVTLIMRFGDVVLHQL